MKTSLLVVVVGLSFITMVKGHGKHVRNRAATESFEVPSNITINGQQVNEKSRCGTKEVTDEIREGGQRALDFYRFNMAREGTDFSATLPKIIPVCFHMIGQRLSRQQLARSLEALNKAFSDSSCCNPSKDWCVAGTCSPKTNIRFVMARVIGKKVFGITLSPISLLACVKYNSIDIDFDDEANGNVLALKKQMRVGDARILNIYLGYLTKNYGYATFPVDYETKPAEDGVFVGRDYIAGGTDPVQNEGDTLVHEVGHWLGVYHTFQDGCLPGDRIDDSPAEAEENRGCNPAAKRDTCPEDDSIDPIHNFMDYSDDICLYTWTKGQIEVMHANIEYYRSRYAMDRLPVKLRSRKWSRKYTMASGFTRHFFLFVLTNSKVRCETRADGGDIDLFMNWDGNTADFDCSSQTLGSIEYCEIGPNRFRKAHAFVYSNETTADFDIMCTIEAV